jgi:TPR repeat protein
LDKESEENLNLALKFYKKSAELGSILGKKNYKLMLRDLSNGGRYFK